MQYYTDWNRPIETPNKPGTKTEDVYKERIQKDGTKKLVKIKETNTYARIQEDKESCDIKKIIEKYGIDPNNSIVEIEETINDFTNMPNDINEIQNILLNAEETFNGASKEIKEYYENDFGKFVNAFGTGQIEKDVKKLKKKFSKEENTILEGQMSIEKIQPKTQDIVEIPKEINTTSSDRGGIQL